MNKTWQYCYFENSWFASFYLSEFTVLQHAACGIFVFSLKYSGIKKTSYCPNFCGTLEDLLITIAHEKNIANDYVSGGVLMINACKEDVHKLSM